MVHSFLKESFEAGQGEWLPCKENVEMFVTAGLLRAKEGDPVVAAWSNGHCLGFLMCLRDSSILKRPAPVLSVEGFYILPELRGGEISESMDAMVKVIAREKGYDQIQAICRNPASYGVGKKRDWTADGVWMMYDLKEKS
jgi:hypothetical protein